MPQSDLSRRAFLAGCATLAMLPSGRVRAESPQMSEDGLYHQPWFLESFLDLQDDFRAARTSGKTFVLLWELKGCPFCKLLHTENFANAKIAAYAQENFAFLQLNFIGSRPVSDFDGQELPEKELARKYAIEGTPTLQFFHESENPIAIETGRVQYLKPAEFLGMLRFIREKAYEDGPFVEWLRAQPSEL